MILLLSLFYLIRFVVITVTYYSYLNNVFKEINNIKCNLTQSFWLRYELIMKKCTCWCTHTHTPTERPVQLLHCRPLFFLCTTAALYRKLQCQMTLSRTNPRRTTTTQIQVTYTPTKRKSANILKTHVYEEISSIKTVAPF